MPQIAATMISGALVVGTSLPHCHSLQALMQTGKLCKAETADCES
jgi:hypothetical protein